MEFWLESQPDRALNVVVKARWVQDSIQFGYPFPGETVLFQFSCLSFRKSRVAAGTARLALKLHVAVCL